LIRGDEMKSGLFGKSPREAFLLWISACLIILTSAGLLSSSDQQKQREEVTVTAVEVPVRVLRNNDFVRGLARDDFEVYENGVKQVISGFEIISRKISGPVGPGPAVSFPQPPKPRLFFLIFDIFDYNDAVGEAIDYFFNRIFGQNDQIVILTEGRLLNIEPGRQLDDLKVQLKETLKRYKVISTQNTYRAYIELEEECDRLLLMIGKEPVPTPAAQDWDQHVTRFYDNYDRIWRTYRQQFLVPDLEIYQAILKRIKPIKADKWAICFQQRELFPEIKSFGRLEQRINTILAGQVDPGDQTRAGLIKVKQQQLQQSFATSTNFPSDRLKNLFLEAGITFHLILMKSPKTLLSEDFELREVAEEYEECFRDISRSTGGYLVFSNKALDALQAAAEKEDYHYVLAYQSRAPLESRGKNIEVKVRVEGARVYSLKNLQKLDQPGITIADVQAGAGLLKFSLKNCTMIKTEKDVRGLAEVQITLFDDRSEIAFSDRRVMDVVKQEVRIVLNLGKLKPGVYFLIIDALDKNANEKDVVSRMIEL
jgi:DNA-binding MltR family transcriptional regulator